MAKNRLKKFTVTLECLRQGTRVVYAENANDAEDKALALGMPRGSCDISGSVEARDDLTETVK